ncbi:MAG: TolC family outer membrane protein [Rhodospirillaceae bacterium]|nr:TolC family outer membrane protein [Rhodospirillaceae bacterium]
MGEAVAYAISTNPEVLEAVANRSAIDFELRQARGLYLPQVDFEGSVGPGWRDGPGPDDRDDHTWLVRREVAVTVQQMVFDGFAADSEVERQASRVDAAAARVLERGEFIGLNVAQAYLDVLRQAELRELALANIRVHEQTLGDVRARSGAGRSSVADVQQAEERLRAAEATLVEIERAYEEARITYQRLVGMPAGQFSLPPPIDSALPAGIDRAVETALNANPSLSLARADIDTAYADFRAANANFWPTLDIEGRASYGVDVNGERGADADLEALLVLRYNLYRGGIDTANREEQIRHIDEARQRLLRFEREVEELIRRAYNALEQSQRRLQLLREQAAVSEQVRNSYRDQFSIGQRTLLDLLDAENALFNTRVAVTESEYAVLFSKYQIVASTGQLLNALGVAPHPGAAGIARSDAGVPPQPESETMDRDLTRTSPSLSR